MSNTLFPICVPSTSTNRGKRTKVQTVPEVTRQLRFVSPSKGKVPPVMTYTVRVTVLTFLEPPVRQVREIKHTPLTPGLVG